MRATNGSWWAVVLTVAALLWGGAAPIEADVIGVGAQDSVRHRIETPYESAILAGVTPTTRLRSNSLKMLAAFWNGRGTERRGLANLRVNGWSFRRGARFGEQGRWSQQLGSDGEGAGTPGLVEQVFEKPEGSDSPLSEGSMESDSSDGMSTTTSSMGHSIPETHPSILLGLGVLVLCLTAFVRARFVQGREGRRLLSAIQR